MTGRWLKLALGLVAFATGPLALWGWNQGMGQGGFAAPVGGDRWFASRPAFFEASGFRDPELSPSGNVFNWVENEATLRFPRVSRSKPARVALRLQGRRTEGRAPEVLLSVDGVEAERIPLPEVPRRVSLDLPQRAGRGALISIKVEAAAGVMVENVRLASAHGALIAPPEAIASLGFVAFAVYAAALTCEVSPLVALLLTLGPVNLAAWLSVKGGAFLGRYSEQLAWLAAVSLILCVVFLAVAHLKWRRALVAVALFTTFKLAALLHPQIIDADAAFHAGNLRRILSGEWFFTSATPPPSISFPYPPGLSVAALPFVRLPQNEWVTVLRGIVISAELLAALAFALCVAGLSTDAVGALTFVFLALSPEGVALLFVGNLSNLFSDALMVAACAFLIRNRPILAGGFLLAGFLSHFGTLLIGAPLAFALAIAARGGSRAAPSPGLFRQLGVAEPRNTPGIPSVQRLDLTKNPSLAAQPDFHQGLLANLQPQSDTGRRVASVVAALAVSFVVYYRHFLSIVWEAWERLTAVKAAALAGPMNAPVSEKLARLAGGEDWWINAALGLLVIAGIVTWPRDQKPLARFLLAWGLVVTAFVLIGLVTPVQVRATLSARPVIAALCASGACALWKRGRGTRFGVSALVLLIATGCWIIATGFFPTRAS